MGEFKEKAFVPNFIEGLAHIQQDNGRKRFPVGGVRQMRNNAYKLKSGRMLSAEPLKSSNSGEIQASRRRSNTLDDWQERNGESTVARGRS